MGQISLFLLAFAAQGLSLPSSSAKVQVTAPISFNPAANFEGIDGLWNVFALRVGNPPQVVRVLPSTASQETWTVAPRACLYEDDKSACADKRGGVFDNTISKNYQNVAANNIFDISLEKNLNYTGNAIFGYDDVGLGYPGEGGLTLEHQIVGQVAVEDFWFGHFGLHPKTTNFTDLVQNVPSFMSSLQTKGAIPSVSWGYTAGAVYRRFQFHLDTGNDQAKLAQVSRRFRPLSRWEDMTRTGSSPTTLRSPWQLTMSAISLCTSTTFRPLTSPTAMSSCLNRPCIPLLTRR